MRFTLPLGIERTDAVRSGSSGSATHGNRYAQGRVAVHFTLPLGIERADAVRSGPSGSATHGNRYAQSRVAVRFTLPLDGERTGPVRSGSSGSATGTLRVEWQCGSRQPVRSGPSGSAGRDGPKLVSATSASGCALSEAGPKPYRERPLREGGISLQLGGCNWVAFLQATTGWPFCRLDGPLFLQAGRYSGRSG